MMEESMKYAGVEIFGAGTKTNNGKQGLWIYKDINEVKYIEANYLNDIKHGIYRSFNRNGQVLTESNYNHGISVGSWKEFYENGQLKEEGHYENNEYFPLNFWLENGEQLMKNGTGKKIEKFGTSGGDVIEFYFSEGRLIKEEKVSSVRYGSFIPKDDLSNNDEIEHS